MKIKKVIAGAVSLCLIGGAIPISETVMPELSITANAETEYTAGTFGVLTYQKYSDHIKISDCYSSAEGDLVIPSKIDGLPVTSIGDNAFCGCYNLNSITISYNVTSIGDSAFFYCSGLTSVTIENPDCEIYDSRYTICNGDSGFTGTIYGYTYSTSHTYAEKYNYTFKSIDSIPLGDVNADCIIDAVDASYILSHYAKNATDHDGIFDAVHKISADVNNDGIIDAVDASHIIGYYAYTATGGTGSIEDYIK